MQGLIDTFFNVRIMAQYLPKVLEGMLVTIALALATLTAAAQLLRIQEFAEARDLVLGKFKRMTG